MVTLENTPVLSVYQYELSGLAMACLLGVLWLVAIDSPSCHEKNCPDSMSGWDLDLDKPVCATSCRGDVTDLAFLRTFLWFSSLIPQLLQLTLEL